MCQTQTISRVDRWALRRVARPPERNPKAFMFLLVSAISTAPTALALQPLPASLQSVPELLARGAAGAFALGCVLCVIGIIWPKRDVGLAFEIAGCIILAVGSFGYSAALAGSTTAAQRAFAFGTTFGLGLGCLARAAQIALYVRGRKLASEETAKDLA